MFSELLCLNIEETWPVSSSCSCTWTHWFLTGPELLSRCPMSVTPPHTRTAERCYPVALLSQQGPLSLKVPGWEALTMAPTEYLYLEMCCSDRGHAWFSLRRSVSLLEWPACFSFRLCSASCFYLSIWPFFKRSYPYGEAEDRAYSWTKSRCNRWPADVF